VAVVAFEEPPVSTPVTLIVAVPDPPDRTVKVAR
jgi:hypothetical protein